MFSRVVAKLFLTATALAPVFLVLAVYDLYVGKRLESAVWFAAFTVLLCFFLCCLHAAKKKLSAIPCECEQICPVDGEPIAFLLAYALPFVSSPCGPFGNFGVMSLFVAICGICVYFSNAWTFNPLLNIAGYHFYQVRIGEGVPFILISKKIIRKSRCQVLASQVDEYIYLDKES